jgi:hypothetical protein
MDSAMPCRTASGIPIQTTVYLYFLRSHQPFLLRNETI